MKITSAHALAFIALVASVGGGMAVGHGGDTDKLHLCIANPGGDVRAVDPEANCAAGETATDIRGQHVTYMERTGRRVFKASPRARLVSKQLIIPDNGEAYLFSAKLVVGKPSTSEPGTISCTLGSTDTKLTDTARVSLDPGEVATLALLTRGITEGRAGETAATEVACQAPGSPFYVSDVSVVAEPFGVVSRGIPIADKP